MEIDFELILKMAMFLICLKTAWNEDFWQECFFGLVCPVAGCCLFGVSENWQVDAMDK
jgi:regulation of enolase protein 1 (concanavalin A-like superfamily)